MLLLEAAVIAKSSTITIGLAITIISGVAGVTANYFILKNKIDKQELANEIHKKYADEKIEKFEERLVGVSASKRATKEAMELKIKELKAEHRAEIEKLENVVTKRIDKTQDKQEQYQKEIQIEIKAIHSGISNIEGFLKNFKR